MPIFLSFLAFCSTLLGGLTALRFRDHLHLILAFSAGAVLGLSFFDLLPEAIELSEGIYEPHLVTAIAALGFLTFTILNHQIGIRPHIEDQPCENDHHHEHAHSSGTLGAGSLAIHSFLDGTAIGLAFQVSAEVGLVVAAAVLMHDFSDGINTVGMILRSKGSLKSAMGWLTVAALAPIAGAASTMLYTVPASTLALLLAFFSGTFIYIGASDLIPESHHRHPSLLTTGMVALGMGVLYLASTVVGH